MNITVTLDGAGRVVIPKTLRDELHLEAGDRMELESEGENVTLRPVRSASPLRKEDGGRGLGIPGQQGARRREDG